MNLSVKIFLSFFTFFTLLLGLTLYIANSQTEQFEIKNLSLKLRGAHQRFNQQLDRELDHTLKLAKTLILDQKFRSFLSQIKDNFYSFSEDIARDADADVVFMVDEGFAVRGIYPTDEIVENWVKKNLDKFPIKDILDTGKETSGIISGRGKLMSSVALPLKESLRDEYALGVMIVIKHIDDQWVKELMGEQIEQNFLQVLFYSDSKIVADNVSDDFGKVIIQNLDQIPTGSGIFIYAGDRYITQKGSYAGNDDKAGYIYATNLDSSLIPFKAIQNKILLTGLALLFVGVLFSIIFSKRIVMPLRSLLKGTEGIIEGNYDFEIKHTSSDEVGQLSSAFNHMLKGLREKKFIQDTFGKYVHPSIVKDILFQSR